MFQTLFVTHEAYAPIPNGAGGITDAWDDKSLRYKCSRAYKTTSNYQNVTGGPGQLSRRVEVLIFDRDRGEAIPAGLKLRDKLTASDGSKYSVINIRRYDVTTQVDVEVVA